MRLNTATQNKAGFSLFELLMTIAILGVMGSLAVTAFGSQGTSFTDIRDRRNAQEITVTCTAARAAGLDFVSGESVEEVVRKVIHGASPTSGAFKNRTFKVSLMAEADIAGASRFLQIQNDELLLQP